VCSSDLNDLISFIKSLDNAVNIPNIAVRVNSYDSQWGKDDAMLISSLPSIDTIVLPKVDDLASLNNAINTSMNDKLIWAMIESSKGVHNCESIATNEQVEALVLGGNDLTKDLKAKFTLDRKHLWYSMSKCVVAARASNKIVIDGVYMDIKDSNGLKLDCELGRDMGFDGKSLIHPDQLAITNDIFSPSLAEISYAKRVIDEWNKATIAGKSVAVIDGKLIEYLHYHEATAVMKKADVIEQLMKHK
jgi:citrate lyase beta subunit